MKKSFTFKSSACDYRTKYLITTVIELKTISCFSGLFLAFSTIGPALGFVMGGFLLRIYGDFYAIDYTT